ncbi:carbohydrate ABC transporter permease, partial [Mesorhizobium sp. M7A.F.Ca.CA.001.10.2.1]
MSGANEGTTRQDRVRETAVSDGLASTLSQDQLARLMRRRGEES